jgi:NitT/TauT family transport system ATP-binding protein
MYIQVKTVSKHYGMGSESRRILNEISFSIEKGSFVSMIGPSGCGKSTMLQIIAGLQAADEGEVILGKATVTSPPFDMVYLFQQYTKSIFPWKTVKENVKFGMESRKKWSVSEIERRSNEMIKLVGLQSYENYYPRQLSGGMQQRVAIARALACEPDVLLMDEPFSAVDAMTRGSLQDLVLDLWRKLGLTILFVTHDIEEAVYLSSRVIVLNRAPRNFAADVAIELPYPRDRLTTPEMPNFLTYRHQLYEEIFDSEKR